jgi:hypothetical protein
LQFDLTDESFGIKVVKDDDPLVLAADVLANVNYLFSSRRSTERYKPLNGPDAVAEHPLASHLNAFRDWGSGEIVGDLIFKHPKASH